ncbi:MAG: HEAT repeat protein [Planctomycetota bacterium]|jgi:HEAT repeat protein
MPRLCLILLTLLGFAGALVAQTGEDPIFGTKPSVKSKTKGNAKKVPDKPAVKLSPDEQLIERLSAWPGQEAMIVARELIIKGPRIVPLLIKNIENNDWRIRCGCAYALGEFKEQSAFVSLQKALRDIANRISLGPFFQAMSKIDPISATSEILPFVASEDVRAAKAAMAALPEVIDQKFEARVIALTGNRNNSVRHRALLLLSKLFKPVAPEVYVRLLNDRAPRVASGAAEILADSRDDAVYKTLTDLVINGSLRSSSYALLSLVIAEDRTNQVLLTEDAKLMKRLMVLLRIRGDLENCVAAVALANMSMHSSSPDLRKFADVSMMDYLLDAVASGKIFKDFISVKDICLQKAAMISGQNFGLNGHMWVDWWLKNRNGFKARRELRAITKSDAPHMRIRFAQRGGSGSFHLEVVAGEPATDEIHVRRPIYVSNDEMVELVGHMISTETMKKRGMRLDPGWVGDYVQLTIALENSEYRRAHYGETPQDLVVFGEELKQISEAHRWQLFWNRAEEADFGVWFRANFSRFDKLSGQEKTRALADEGLRSFSQLDPRSRRAARQAFTKAGPEWLAERKDQLLKLLDPSTLRLDASTEVLATLAHVGGHDVMEAVISYLPLFRADGGEALREYLARRPLAEVLEHDDGNRPHLRAALIPYFAEHMKGQPKVIEKLLSFMTDVDSRVRTALVESLAKVPKDELLVAMKDRITLVESQDQLSFVELFGAIGGESVVASLRDAYRTGSQPLRVSVIKALNNAGGSSALQELLNIAKNDEVAFYRVEALSALANIGTGEVRAGVRKLLAGNMKPERLRESMGVCTRIFRASLDRDFVPFLVHEDPTIRKEAALLLGPLGIKASAPELMKLLLDETESNRAWEYLELITCHSVVTPGGEEALTAYRKWFKEHDGEAQHEWFMAAMKAQGLPSQQLLGYLEGKAKPLRAISLLIRAMDSESWFIRVNAFNYLARIRGAHLGKLDRRSTPAEVQKVRNRWSEWYNALIEGF